MRPWRYDFCWGHRFSDVGKRFPREAYAGWRLWTVQAITFMGVLEAWKILGPSWPQIHFSDMSRMQHPYWQEKAKWKNARLLTNSSHFLIQTYTLLEILYNNKHPLFFNKGCLLIQSYGCDWRATPRRRKTQGNARVNSDYSDKVCLEKLQRAF